MTSDSSTVQQSSTVTACSITPTTMQMLNNPSSFSWGQDIMLKQSLKRLISPVNSPRTVGTCSSSSLRSSSFLATHKSSRGHASSSDVVFNMTRPKGARAGDWISCRVTDNQSVLRSFHAQEDWRSSCLWQERPLKLKSVTDWGGLRVPEVDDENQKINSPKADRDKQRHTPDRRQRDNAREQTWWCRDKRGHVRSQHKRTHISVSGYHGNWSKPGLVSIFTRLLNWFVATNMSMTNKHDRIQMGNMQHVNSILHSRDITHLLTVVSVA